MKQEQIERFKDSQKEILQETYQQQKRHTNIIIMAGYATFFGLWKITESSLSEWHVVLSCLLVSISASLFVIFQVLNMFIVQRNIMSFSSTLQEVEDKKSEEEINELLEQYSNFSHKQTNWLIWLWSRFFWPGTILTGLSGIGILMGGFINHLIFS